LNDLLHHQRHSSSPNPPAEDPPDFPLLPGDPPQPKPPHEIIIEKIRQFFNSLREWLIKEWFKPFQDSFLAIMNALRAIIDFLKKVVKPIPEMIHWLHNRIEKFFEELRRDLTLTINESFERVRFVLTHIQEFLSEKFTWLHQETRKQVDHARERISEKVYWFYKEMRSLHLVIDGIILERFKWLRDQILLGIPGTTKAITGRLFGIFGEFFTAFVNWLRMAWRWVVEFITQDFVEAMRKAFMWMIDLFQSYAKRFWDNIWATFERFSPIRPEMAPAVGAAFFAQATGTGFLAHAIAVGAQKHPLLRAVPFQYLSGFLGDISGWKSIEAATIGTIMRDALAGPFKYYANFRLRPWIISQSDLVELYSRGRIPTPYFHQMMAYYGFSDDMIEIMDELKNTPLSPFILADMARAGAFTREEAAEEIRRRGFSETAQKAALRWIEAEKKDRAMRIASVALEMLYREGWLTVEQLKIHLKEIGFLPEVINPLIIALQVRKKREMLNRFYRAVVAGYRRDLIDDVGFVDYLMEQGMIKEDAWHLLAVEQMRKYGETRLPPTRAPIKPPPPPAS